ncbi:MAG TPA: protein kinase [Kofleriaceae bacterium]
MPAPALRLGDYALAERLGEGASGTVYRAADASGAPVAVKLLGAAAELEPEAARARFAREVKILASLDHPSLVHLVDHGVDDELGPYLVMPLVAGRTLRAAVTGAKLCPEAAIVLAEPIAAAIAALHAQGLVHRDLKPENIMLGPDGRVVVVDLGLAWGPAHTRHSVEGAAIGTVPYMAPEQLEGAGVGTAADVWAIGVMLYELVAGKRPFARARAAEEAAAALVGAYAPLDAVDARCPPELVRLVAQALDRVPASRPSAADVATELAAMIDWADPAEHGRERAAIAHAPAAYTARVAPFRVRREKRLAREAIEARRPFAALAHVDRALAYAPDDPELRSLADEAERKSSPEAPTRDASGPVVPTAILEPPASQAPPHQRRTLAIVAAAVLGAATVGGTAVALVNHLSSEPSEPPHDPWAPPALGSDPWKGPVAHASTPPPVTPDAAPPDDIPTSTAKAPHVTKMPIEGLAPLAREGIPNDLPNRLDEMKAPPGENLVPESRLLAAPAQAMADADRDLAKNPDRRNRLGQAMVYIGAGHTQDGLAKLEQLLADEPDYADAWAAKGYVEVRAGHGRTAEAAMSKAIELSPDDAETLRNRGILRDHAGHARDAYDDLVAALQRAPNDIEAMAELAHLYGAVDRREDARPILERLVQLRPTDPAIWLDLSLVQPSAEALASIQHALALDPKSARGNQRLCNVLTEAGRHDALAACDVAVKLAPTDAWAWMGRGLARYQLGGDKAGLDDVDRAIQLEPNSGQFYINRYVLRSHAGMTAEARGDLDKACKLGKSEACTELKKK